MTRIPQSQSSASQAGPSPMGAQTQPKGPLPKSVRPLGAWSGGVGGTARGGRGILRAGVAGGIARVVSIAAGFLTVSLAIATLGPAQYGAVALLLSVPASLAFADFGVGGSVTTLLARESAATSDSRARQIVFAAIALTSAAGLLVLMLGIPLTPTLAGYVASWSQGTMTADQATQAVAVVVACVALGPVSGLAVRILWGSQRGDLVAFAVAATSALVLGATYLASALEAGVAGFLAAAAAVPVGVGLLTGFVVLYRVRPEWRPSLRKDAPSKETATGLLKGSGLFASLAITGAVSYQIDAAVVSAMLGTSSTATFSVTARVFMSGSVLLGLFLTPIWPAAAAALSVGQVDPVRRWMKKAVVGGSLAMTIYSLFMLMALPRLVPWWTQGEVTAVPTALSLGFSAFLLTNAITGTTAMILNGASVLGVQIAGASVAAAVNLAASIALTSQIGISGPIWGTVVAQVLVTIPINVWATHRALRVSQ